VVLYLLMWATVPKANEASGLQLSALDVKLAQTAQIYAFPITAFLQWGFQLPDVLGSWISGALFALLIAAWLLLQQQQFSRILPIMIWCVVVMLPAWLFLDAGYLLGSPRLHYLASTGVAMLWGSMLARPFPQTWSLGLQWAARVVVIALIMFIAIPFIQARMNEHQQLDKIYRQVGSIADSMPEQERLLLINGPAYLAPFNATFLLGAEGSTYLPDFIELSDWLKLNGFRNIVADNRRVDDIIPPSDKRFAVTHPLLDRQTIE
ncbi:MAG: hypothetical protein CUN55_16530, partial [Phototrophicales bacterium]